MAVSMYFSMPSWLIVYIPGHLCQIQWPHLHVTRGCLPPRPLYALMMWSLDTEPQSDTDCTFIQRQTTQQTGRTVIKYKAVFFRVSFSSRCTALFYPCNWVGVHMAISLCKALALTINQDGRTAGNGCRDYETRGAAGGIVCECVHKPTLTWPHGHKTGRERGEGAGCQTTTLTVQYDLLLPSTKSRIGVAIRRKEDRHTPPTPPLAIQSRHITKRQPAWCRMAEENFTKGKGFVCI
jgi:hypothetical protein